MIIVVVVRMDGIFTPFTDLRTGLYDIPLDFCFLGDTNICEQEKLLS